jgi:hypothetical protein
MNDKPKNVYNISYMTWAMNYKILWNCNLWKMDIFFTKLMSFLLLSTYSSLDKHSNLLRNLYFTNL